MRCSAGADLLEEGAVLAHDVEVAQARHFERAEIVGKLLERNMPKFQSNQTKQTNKQTHPTKTIERKWRSPR
jgi:hypothetical protein